MKRFMILVSTFVLACGVIAHAQNYTKNGKVFEQQKSEKSAPEARKTEYTWRASDGTEYPIFLSSKGAAYIIKTSKKTGKTYKQYLPKSVAKDMK